MVEFDLGRSNLSILYLIVDTSVNIIVAFPPGGFRGSLDALLLSRGYNQIYKSICASELSILIYDCQESLTVTAVAPVAGTVYV